MLIRSAFPLNQRSEIARLRLRLLDISILFGDPELLFRIMPEKFIRGKPALAKSMHRDEELRLYFKICHDAPLAGRLLPSIHREKGHIDLSFGKTGQLMEEIPPGGQIIRRRFAGPVPPVQIPGMKDRPAFRRHQKGTPSSVEGSAPR